MSGGHFDYQQYRLNDIANEIARLIDNNDDPEDGIHYPPEIIEKFEETVFLLRRGEAMVQRIDWLVSGDDGEERFLRRWENEVPPARIKGQ